MTIRSSLGLSCLLIALAGHSAVAQEQPAAADADVPMLLAAPAAPEGAIVPPATDAAAADTTAGTTADVGSPPPVPPAPAANAEIEAAPLPTASDAPAPEGPVGMAEIPPEIDIKPHQAMYRLTLGNIRIKDKVLQASGMMEVKISRDCFHWSLDRQLDFRIVYANNKETHMIVTDRQRESLGGEKFWFWSRTMLNGGTAGIVAGVGERPKPGQMVPLLESMDAIPAAPATPAPPTGEAAAAAPGGEPAPPPVESEPAPPPVAEIKAERPAGVTIVFDWPVRHEVEVPPEVVFPFTAIRQQLLALHAGALLNEQHVFDGSRTEGADRALYAPTTDVTAAAALIPDGNPELLNTPFWRLATSYAPMEVEDAKPTRTVTMKLHENGIVSETAIDYGPFVVKGTLAWVKELPTPSCK